MLTGDAVVCFLREEGRGRPRYATSATTPSSVPARYDSHLTSFSGKRTQIGLSHAQVSSNVVVCPGFAFYSLAVQITERIRQLLYDASALKPDLGWQTLLPTRHRHAAPPAGPPAAAPAPPRSLNFSKQLQFRCMVSILLWNKIPKKDSMQ